MLQTVLQFIAKFWVYSAYVAAALFFIWLGRRSNRVSAIERRGREAALLRDSLLIDSAITKVEQYNQDPTHTAFIRLTGLKLESLVYDEIRSGTLARKLGITALTASAISSFVTGSTFFGTFTVGLSFTVTSVGSVCLAIATFLNVDQKAVSTRWLADRIRIEITEYVGDAAEYATLKPDEAYTAFVNAIALVLQADVELAFMASKKKSSEKTTGDITDDSGLAPPTQP
jgi:hypothetical protein